ncbi:hypothetical protein LCGC14_0949160 [marine sediment metagenome]|uniref:Uncharacterized protein n=1 Tax=marine sediment metagenome TaxID=412755 RepID=A0A0F9RP78_9ZZZZ
MSKPDQNDVQVSSEVQAMIDRMHQSDTDYDDYPQHDFVKFPILQGVVMKVKVTEQIRRGEVVPVQLAIVDTGKETITLWESSNLEIFFQEIRADSRIVVIYKGDMDLGGGKHLKMYDAYHE